MAVSQVNFVSFLIVFTGSWVWRTDQEIKSHYQRKRKRNWRAKEDCVIQGFGIKWNKGNFFKRKGRNAETGKVEEIGKSKLNKSIFLCKWYWLPV